MRFAFIAFNLLPLTRPGSVRATTLAKYLTRLGHSVDFIVSLDPGLPFRWGRVPYTERGDLAANMVNTPDFLSLATPLLWLPAIDSCVTQGARLCEAHQYDVLVSSAFPLAPCVAASKIAQQTGIPHLLELRDPMSDNPIRRWRSYLHYAHEYHVLDGMLGKADGVIFNTMAARASALRTYPSLSPERAHALPHGIDADLIADRPQPPPRFTVGFSGSFYALHDRKARNPFAYTIDGRAVTKQRAQNTHPRYLMEAFARLLRERRIPSDSCLRLITQSPGVSEIAASYGLGSNAIITKRVARHELYATLRGCSVLYLPNVDAPPPSPFISSKTMDYLACGTPFVFSLPPGENHEIARRSGLGHPVALMDASALSEGLASCFEDYHVQGVSPEVNTKLLSRFQYAALAQEFVEISQAALSVKKRDGSARKDFGTL